MSAVPKPLAGRVAVVTGAGSLPGRGIGREIVANLAGKGARVLAADIDAGTAQNTPNGASPRAGTSAHYAWT